MEKDGNSATELYVQRTVADLVRERDGLKADLDQERKLKNELAAKKDTNEETLRIVNKINNDIALRNTAVKQPTLAGQIGCIPAHIDLFFAMYSFSGEDWVAAALTAAFPSPARVEILCENGCGDISFEINGRRVMFEVKNYERGTVKGRNKGEEIAKFFRDAEQIHQGYR